MTYIIDGVVVIVGYDSEGQVVSLTFPFDTNPAGMPLVITFTPSVAVATIQDWLKQIISLLGLSS